jgi:hypothetical protein
MAISKTSRTLYASASLAAGASINVTELNLSTAAGARVFVKITNGGTGPSTAPTVKFYSGEATGVKRELAASAGDLVAGSVTHHSCRYGLPDMFANVTITAGATQGCTVECYAQEASSL